MRLPAPPRSRCLPDRLQRRGDTPQGPVFALCAAAVQTAALAVLGLALHLWPAAVIGADPVPLDNLRTHVQLAPPHGNCPHGAHILRLGQDRDGNGVLDPRETDHSATLCKPPPGPEGPGVNASTLIRIANLPGQARCATGGILVSAEPSFPDERAHTSSAWPASRWCARAWPDPSAARRVPAAPLPSMLPQADPPASAPGLLVRLSAEADTGLCGRQGTRADAGLDSNRNGHLDREEIAFTQHLCDDSDPRHDGDDDIAALPHEARIGQVVQFSRQQLRPWRIAQSPGQRINTEQLSGAWGGNWTGTGPKARWSAIAQSADGRRVIAAGDGVLLRSEDSGHTWLPTGPAQALRWTGVAASANGQRWVATSISDAIYTSDDAGHTWQRRSLGLGWGLVASSADGQRLVATRYGSHLLVSTDAGRTWTRRAPQAAWTALASSADGQVLAAAARGGRLHLSRDGGDTWTVLGAPMNHTGVAITADGRRVFTSATGTDLPLRWTDDGGQTWQVPEQAPWTEAGVTALAVSSQGQSIVAAGADGRLWSSVDGGLRWRAEWAGPRISALGITAEGLARIALTDGDSLYRSASATTPGSRGTLNLHTEDPVSLRYLGTGVWEVVALSGRFYVQ